jgi:serine/threonine-protein kinase
VDADFRSSLIGHALEGTSGVRYYLCEMLDEGGQGWVFRASQDSPQGPTVVVKMLRPEAVQEGALFRFEREASVLRVLGNQPAPSPHIVRFYDYGVHTAPLGGTDLTLPFLVIEHVAGQTLGRVIAGHGGFGLPVARVRRIMGQVARGLWSLHEMRIVHRDLKPSNILLAQDAGQEIAKITDYGLVKVPDASAYRTTSFAGASLGYAPPEQYEMGNHRVAAQTDVFSFAAILFEMLCGTEAFPCGPGDNPLRVVSRMLTGERPQLARVLATVPAELRDRPDLVAALDREIARATQPDPAHRHGSIKELWLSVDPLLRDGSRKTGAMAVSEPEPEHGFLPSQPEMPAPELPAPSAAVASGPAPVAAPMPAWQPLGPPIAGERIRAALLVEDGRAVLAVGARGLFRLANGAWAPAPLPASADPRFVRGLLRLPGGELLLYGDAGFAVQVSPRGAARRLPLPDRDMVLLGAHMDEHGLVLVGERMSRPLGVVVLVPSGGSPMVRAIEGTARLSGAARLGNGALLVAGTQGALLEISTRAEREVPWGRTGHLYAMATGRNGEAYAVGSGGHALTIAPALDPTAPPVATLEGVQTTRDLVAVAVDPQGAAWSAGAAARLVQRRDQLWTRIPLDPSVTGSLIAVLPRSDSIVVVAEDGSAYEGRGFG